MDLERCVIVLRNHMEITCDSVEHSLGVIENNHSDEISAIKIDASDGSNIHSYHFNTIDESLESLMNL
ncbi:hypothetical protein J4N42_15160 [Vibrio sp. SCSIO 43135]|uniref:Uncharacterized protein n=1 Tax=Vibrio paucivorans TaxID=2829489 RepID=A0A9X3HTG0_9VIBR|nr:MULTISPECIES: hypothetical protein [Vibrio]MCW8335800.1 hypothetical protein [Vibrio paucivorans]USD43514.1 hypothetical protein J4N42_15160 [Vibrio sp. SCSIO 43135]